MSKLTKLQEISHLLVKIHNQRKQIDVIRREIDVLLNSHEPRQVTNNRTQPLSCLENVQLLTVNAL
jgi:hypothetical protein